MNRNRASQVKTGSALLAMLLFAVAGAFTPQVMAAEVETEDLRACMDREWAEYNECLVEESTSWGKKLCDIYFQADAALCSAKQIGKIRNAFNGAD